MRKNAVLDYDKIFELYGLEQENERRKNAVRAALRANLSSVGNILVKV